VIRQLAINRHNRPIASQSERVFVRAKFLDPLAPKPHQSCARTNEPVLNWNRLQFVALKEKKSG
jgi:hypothetical protein